MKLPSIIQLSFKVVFLKQDLELKLKAIKKPTVADPSDSDSDSEQPKSKRTKM